MNRNIVIIIAATIAATSLTGCRLLSGQKDAPPSGVEYKLSDAEFGIVRDWCAARLGNQAARSVQPPRCILMETKSEHNGRPYFALKDVGNVTAYYDRRWKTIFFAADPADATRPHPYIMRPDGIARCHEYVHAIEHGLGMPHNGDHEGVLFPKPRPNLARYRRGR